MKKIFLILCISLSFAQNGKLAVSILDFKGEDVQQKVLRACYQQLETSLIESNRFIVIEKSQREELLKEQEFISSGVCDEACAVEIGEMVGAEYLMLGEIIGFGDLFQVNIKIISIEKGDVAEKVTDQISGGMRELLSGMETASREIVRRIASSGQSQNRNQEQGASSIVTEMTYGNLDISTMPSGANILLDGIEKNVTPQTIEKIETGPHNLVLVYPGYETLQKRVMIEEGKTIVISEYLVPKTGSLSILSSPIAAKVYLDEILKGETPLDMSELLVKDYMIRLELQDYETIESRITVQYNQNSTQKYDLNPLPGILSIITFPTEVDIQVGAERLGTNQAGMVTLSLSVGKHMLKLTKKGYEPTEKTVTITANVNQTLDISLTKIPAGVSSNPNMGFLTVNSFNHNAKVKISKVKATQSLPLEYFELKYGKYQLKAFAKGFESEKLSVNIERQKTAKIDITLTPKNRGKAFKYSALFPGGGQYYAGSKTKGLIFSITALSMGAILIEGVPSYYNENRWLDEYQENYQLASTADEIDATWQIYNQQVTTVNNAQTKLMIVSGTLISAWLSNMIDAYFFSGL